MAGMERIRIADRLVRDKNFRRSLAESATDPLPKAVTFNPETKQFAYVKEVTERVRAAYIRVDKGQSMTHVVHECFSASKGLRIEEGREVESILVKSDEIAMQFKFRVGIK